MTLVELVVSISMLGLLVSVLSAAIVVTLRQQDNTEGRLNVAVAEQAISMFIPPDLASANIVDTSPQATPCGATVCDGIDLSGGSNVLQLEWDIENADGTISSTRVSYHFAPAADGQTYELSRIECQSTAGSPWVCSSRTVLRDLPGPPGGDPFVPGVANGAACSDPVNPAPCTRPTWVIIISEPLAADAIAAVGDPTPIGPARSERKDANRVIVSINGGGDAAGAGGGLNQISITAGGTVRQTIDANSVQGAPSFTEARSRCGGPMTLVVDESGSIGSSAIVSVRNSVRTFIEKLAGTPVQLQIVRFDSMSSILGGGVGEWQRYFDMTNQADVNALLGAVDQLRSNGGTNWEDALFRTFYQPDGSVTGTIPETVVFFTDGVPTYDRLDRTDGRGPFRASPGVLPPLPAPPSAPWAQSTGSSYTQVGFNRSDFIASKFRQSTRFIGVAVGPNIKDTQQWIADPGAGYSDAWERGSYSHVRDTYRYQARYQVRNASTGGQWQWVDLPTYTVAPTNGSNRKRDEGWTTITEAQHTAANTSSFDDWNDGLTETLTGSAPVSTVEYNANSSNPNYRAVSKTWNNGPDWETWTGSRPGSSSHYRSTKVYNTPPYTGFDPAQTVGVRSDQILARLIAGNDTGTPAIIAGGVYTNAEIADMYVDVDWSKLQPAMEQIALGECGGTLTLQTKVGGTTPANDAFRYQNSAVTDYLGDPVALEPTVVTTSRQFTTGTFDFVIPNGQFIDVDIKPQNYSELSAYTPGAWTCKAGNQNRPVQILDVDGGGAWKGIRVRVAANEAVSCTLAVT
jgi:hypothetical protein